MKSHAVIVVTVVFLSLLSGCSLQVADDGTSPSTASTATTTTEGMDSLPPNTVLIGRSPGSGPTANETGFHYTGAVIADLQAVDSNSFNNVTLCLYDEQWNVVVSRNLGTFESGRQEVPVTINMTTVPKWIIVEHPDFRDREVYHSAMVRQDGGFQYVWRNEIDAPPLSEVGTCR